jgi:hypothetical protein
MSLTDWRRDGIRLAVAGVLLPPAAMIGGAAMMNLQDALVVPAPHGDRSAWFAWCAVLGLGLEVAAVVTWVLGCRRAAT